MSLYLSQDESYDLHDRKAFAKFLIDADIRLVPCSDFHQNSFCSDNFEINQGPKSLRSNINMNHKPTKTFCNYDIRTIA